MLSAEERLKRIRESKKRWQQAHPEKNKLYRERWILKKAAQLMETRKEAIPEPQGGENIIDAQ